MTKDGKLIPVLTILAIIVTIWYLAVVWLNAPFEYDQGSGRAPLSSLVNWLVIQ